MISVDNMLQTMTLAVSFCGFFSTRTENHSSYVVGRRTCLPIRLCEPWGWSVMRRMACGLPAIGVIQVGCAELILRWLHETQAYLPIGDIEHWQGAICHWLSEGSRKGRCMGNAARSRVEIYNVSVQCPCIKDCSARRMAPVIG